MTPLFRTPADAPRWKRLALYSPVARIVIFALLVAALAFLLGWTLKAGGYEPRDVPRGVRALVRFAVQAFAVVVAYLAVVKFVERRRAQELSLPQCLPLAAAGFAWGAILITAVVALMWLAGAYHVERLDTTADWVVPLLTGGLGAALSEEIVFRGVLFRMTEEGLGSGMALALSSAFFGVVHLFNDGATWWSVLAISVEAGLLLGLIYQLTRTLWVCIGLHMGWNYFQGYVWGIPVSGTKAPSLVVSERSGADWLTGGTWGAEGSLLAVLLNVALVLVLFAAVRRRNHWIPWRGRGPIMEPTPSGSAPC